MSRGARGDRRGACSPGATLRARLSPVTVSRFIGTYEVGAELGRGAAGVVYRARERVTGREVALKVVSRELAASPGFYERFRREASAAARVLDVHVAALLGAGEQEGTLFLAFELVSGGSLADQLKARGRLPWREATSRAAEVARGLAAVHGAGLVHRDVTPANVLLDKDGHAKLADFGLVRRIGARSPADVGRLTETGEVLGTLEYLSPEQANGSGEVGPSSDLYGLGALLHALVAGEPPFRGDAYGLVKQHLLAPPPRLSSLVPDVPASLEATVQRLLEKDPVERGSDALAVAQELEALLGDSSPGEAPAPESGRLKLLAGLFALGMGALGLGAGWLARLPATHPTSKPTPSPGATPSPAPTRGPSSEQAALEAQRQDPELKEIAQGLATRGLKLEGIWGRPAWTTRSQITAGAVAPSGKWLATGGMDWVVRRWDLDGHLLETLPYLTQGWVMSIAISPDGEWIALSGDRRFQRPVVLYQLATRLRRELPIPPGPADSLEFSRDGRRLLSTHADGTLRIWDVENPADSVSEVTCVRAGEPSPAGFHWQLRYLDGALSPDGHRAISGCADGTARVWELSSCHEVATFGFPTPVTHVAWSPADDRALVGLMGGRVGVLDLAADKTPAPLLLSVSALSQPVFALAFAPDGLSAIVTHSDGILALVDLSGPPRVAKTQRVAPPGPLPFARFLPDGRSFVVGGDSRAIGLFDAATGADRRPGGAGHRGAIWGLCVSPDGRRALTASTDGTLKLWDPATGKETAQLRASDDASPFVWAGILPDGRRALTSSMAGEACLWDLDKGTALGAAAQIVPLPGVLPPGYRPQLPLRLALLPDGQRFVAALTHGGIEVREVESLVRRAVLRASGPDPVDAVAVSPDGTQALTASEGGELVLWDLARQEGQTLQARTTQKVEGKDKLVSAAFVPGTRTALVGACDSSVELWDLGARSEPLRRYAISDSNNAQVPSLVVAPNGRRFAAACEDGTVRLWEVATGEELGRLDLALAGDVPQRLALMDGGRTLLVGTARGVVYRFAADWGE